MIWDLIEQSTFDKYFSSPGLQIVTLLLDENIITELKNQNPKLLQYLNANKQAFINELIKYTIVMPCQSEGYDRCHKLPYISSELLAIDSELIYQQFFKKGVSEIQNAFWTQLIGFLDTPAAQNQVLMGYFEKVVNNLYNGNKVKTTVIVAHFLQKFIALANNGSIGDIIKKSIILLVTPEGEALSERLKIVDRVIDIFTVGSEQIEKIAADILVDVINKFQSFSSGDIILHKLLASLTLHKIYEKQNSSAVNTFLVGLLRKSQQKTINEKDESVPLIKVPPVHFQSLKDYLIRQSEKIGSLTDSSAYLTNQSHVTVRKSNRKIYPLLQLISLSIECSIEQFISSELINNLWNLLVLYPYNNILQVSILQIFMNMLTKTSVEVKEKFLNHYQSYLLEIAKQNMHMFRPFIFTVWKTAKQIQTVTTDQALLKEFSQFVVGNLQPLLKYEIKNNLHHSSNHNQKLIVDEEDKQAGAAQSISEYKDEALNDETSIQKQQKQSSNDIFVPQMKVATSDAFEQFSFGTKEQKKDDFDFFNSWSAETSKQNQVVDKAKFDDFSFF